MTATTNAHPSCTVWRAIAGPWSRKGHSTDVRMRQLSAPSSRHNIPMLGRLLMGVRRESLKNKFSVSFPRQKSQKAAVQQRRLLPLVGPSIPQKGGTNSALVSARIEEPGVAIPRPSLPVELREEAQPVTQRFEYEFLDKC